MIDTREHNGPSAVKFFLEHGIDSELVTLSTDTGADYFIANSRGSAAVQRKVACSELISELDETLNETIPHLKDFSENPVLLIEENFIVTSEGYLMNRLDSRESQLLATSYFGYLETIRKTGVDVVCTRDYNESLWYMLSQHNYLGKEHYPPHRKYFGIEEQCIGMLSCIPTIGEKKASAMLKKQSIREIAMNRNSDVLTVKQNERLRKVIDYADRD